MVGGAGTGSAGSRGGKGGDQGTWEAARPAPNAGNSSTKVLLRASGPSMQGENPPYWEG